MKIIWLSDLHFCADELVLGHDTAARIDAATSYINQHHSDADLCIISGDLVNRGTSGDYQALAQHLSGLGCALYPMAGNHDDRALLRSAFDLPATTMPGFVQYRIDHDDATILCLDTQCAGSDHGEFCTERCQWLEQQLTETAGRPALVFMHHPPFALDLPMQDGDNIRDAEPLLAILGRHHSVAQLFIGHVHRAVCGVARGIPYATMRAVSFQAPAPRPTWSWQQFSPAAEAPNLGVINATDGDINLQYLQFCEHALGT